MKSIFYQGTTYPIREIYTEKFGHVKVSIESLSSEILDDSGEYVSDEAERIDEEIIYYVEDELIYDSEEAIINELNKNIT